MAKFTVDHDLHIHSQLSSCSGDEQQTPTRILQYAKENGLSCICLTDHYWDRGVIGASSWYAPQDFDHLQRALPLPQDKNVRFLFGCEAELNRSMTLSIPRTRYADFDFIIIPTTHLHMRENLPEQGPVTNAIRARLWGERLEAVLNMDLPFHKVGIAHLACGLINNASREAYLETLDLISSEEMERLFKKAAKVGVGIELNFSDMSFVDEETERVLRMFRIAKACGCKFYLGSDAHHPHGFNKVITCFGRAIELLGLTQEDKFSIENLGVERKDR